MILRHCSDSDRLHPSVAALESSEAYSKAWVPGLTVAASRHPQPWLSPLQGDGNTALGCSEGSRRNSGVMWSRGAAWHGSAPRLQWCCGPTRCQQKAVLREAGSACPEANLCPLAVFPSLRAKKCCCKVNAVAEQGVP